MLVFMDPGGSKVRKRVGGDWYKTSQDRRGALGRRYCGPHATRNTIIFTNSIEFFSDFIFKFSKKFKNSCCLI